MTRRSGGAGLADGAGGGEQNAVTFDHVDALGAGADFDADGGPVGRCLGGWIKLGGVVGFARFTGCGATGQDGGGQKGEQTGQEAGDVHSE